MDVPQVDRPKAPSRSGSPDSQSDGAEIGSTDTDTDDAAHESAGTPLEPAHVESSAAVANDTEATDA